MARFAPEKQSAHAELRQLCEEPLCCYSTRALGLAVKPTALKKKKNEEEKEVASVNLALWTGNCTWC